MVGVALAAVDIRPRGRVHDHVGGESGAGLQHGVAVAHIEPLMGRSQHLVTLEGVERLAAQLTARAGDENTH